MENKIFQLLPVECFKVIDGDTALFPRLVTLHLSQLKQGF